MKPKILIDTLLLLAPLSGIGRYTYEIAKIIEKNREFEYNYFYGYISKYLIKTTDTPTTKSMRSLIVKNPLLKSIARAILFRLSGVMTSQYDLYWQPNFILRKNVKARKKIATVHDFSWEIYPEFQPSERVQYFQKNFYTQLMKCDHIITGSKFTKSEIIERTGISSEKITVIYHGVNHDVFYPRSEAPAQKYLLAVGSIEPRKNLKNLLEAYTKLDRNIKDRYNLILVGASGWNNSEIMDLIESLKEWVQYSGYVSDEALAHLYSQASLFIYPSLYEGFGIPPLEAMACGVPVVASKASSLPEVCGDAAYYVDPLDADSITEAIITVLNDENLKNDLVKKGLSRAKEFSWERSAKAHLAVFEEVLKK